MMKNFQNGSVYITALIFIFLTSLFAAGFLLIASIEFRHMIRDQWSLTALNLAEAGVDQAIWALKNNDWGGWTISSEPYTRTISAFTDSDGKTIGSYYVSVTNPTSTSSYYIATIEATGYSPAQNAEDKIERTIQVSVGVYDGGNTGNIKSALSTNCETKIAGSLIVDGRDHDPDDATILTAAAADIPCIANNGVWGIYTTIGDADLDTTGSYDIGGTDYDASEPKPDYPPDKPYNPNIVCLNASSYPSTPDAVLDFEDGSLKKIAQAGINGSRYTTDPTTLASPLSGVTYVEADWNVGGTLVLNGTGILVVHNSATSAVLQNLNQGTFKGIIIGDDVLTFKNNVIGAVFALTASSSMPTGIVGVGDGRILYSEETVGDAFDDAGGSGTTVLTWQEK